MKDNVPHLVFYCKDEKPLPFKYVHSLLIEKHMWSREIVGGDHLRSARNEMKFRS